MQYPVGPGRYGCICLLLLVSGTHALAQDAGEIVQQEEIEVIGVTPTHGVGLPEALIPYNIQSAGSTDLDRAQSLNISDFLNRNLGSININEAQSNPLQPDIQYRGFSASPLLGLPQGISIFQDGVRVNEPFGDTINWDLIQDSAISSINLVGGSNPLFGLNTLGGALSITTKTGFSDPGHSAELAGGSFGRIMSSVESGGYRNNWGYFVTASYFEEDGWREDSASDAINLFGTASWHTESSMLDISLARGDTELRGNGPLPVQLLALDRSTIFTSPDITENDMTMVNAQASHWYNDNIQFSGNIFYRVNNTDSFNGDGTEFDTDGTHLVDDNGDRILDQFGLEIEDINADGSERDAINNLSTREQEGFGGSLQTTFMQDLWDHRNQAIAGASYIQGLTDFDSQVEIAFLNPDRSTSGTGLFVPDESTVIKTHTRTWSLYFTDTYSVTDTLALTLSARYNNTSVVIGDRNTANPTPELNGEHDYERINPAAGFTWQFTPTVSLYGSYSESSRAPTPIELACADPDAPCNLPNAFLADPPLEQVVAESWEAGLRGKIKAPLFNAPINWQLGGFRTENKNDIIFISTGGVSANEGYFDNIGETQRLGLEVGLDGKRDKLDWFLNYAFVNATFETDFPISSPNHPFAVAGEIQVLDGDRIPGIPQHTLKIGADYAFTPRISLGADVLYNSGQYLRGDEANLLDTIEGYAVANLRGRFQINKNIALFASINNIFDADYETFGLLGEPDEVLGPAFDDPRFLGPGAPLSGFIGISIEI